MGSQRHNIISPWHSYRTRFSFSLVFVGVVLAEDLASDKLENDEEPHPCRRGANNQFQRPNIRLDHLQEGGNAYERLNFFPQNLQSICCLSKMSIAVRSADS
jgi:hypothetical protein